MFGRGKVFSEVRAKFEERIEEAGHELDMEHDRIEEEFSVELQNVHASYKAKKNTAEKQIIEKHFGGLL